MSSTLTAVLQRVRHSRMLLAGIQAESGLDPRLKHSGVTVWSRISSPQPQFSKETQFLRAAVGLSAALSQMHGRGLVHKDLKPANILVNRASGEARLTGFGIALRLPRERHATQ